MYRYRKEKRLVKVKCPRCNSQIQFTIPESVVSGANLKFPIAFRYVHGVPPHSVTVYLDSNFDIRGVEFGDEIQLSQEIIDNLYKERQISKYSDSAAILQTLFNTMTTVIDARVPESGVILYDIGLTMGKNFQNLFQAKEMEPMITEVANFWKDHKFGEIDEIKIGKDLVSFNVYNCFECSHIPNIGRPVCKFDEGFFTNLISSQFNKKFVVEETECYGTGHDHCCFSIKPLKTSS